jgi:hypothetical protein
MQKEIVVALIGAGRVGREHAANLGSFLEVHLALVCNPVLEAVQVAGKLTRAENVTDSAEGDASASLLKFRSGAQGVVQNYQRASTVHAGALASRPCSHETRLTRRTRTPSRRVSI